MPRIIALTGATGFLGQHLLKGLLDNGYGVKALARRPGGLSGFSHKNLEVIEGDLATDLSGWAKGADCVIHLAGLVKAPSWKHFESVNVNGAKAVAKAAENANVPRLILLSSMTAREPGLSFYAKSKKLGEQAVKAEFSGKLAVIRAPAVFGPGDKATKPIFDLMKRGFLLVAGGRGWKTRSVAMVYVHDLVDDLIARALKGEYDNKSVSPATVKALSMPELANYGEDAFNRSVRAFPVPLFILYPIAAITTLTLRLFSIGHLSLGKLAEFRYEHWQSNDLVSNPTPMVEAISKTVQSYDAPE
ncbi:NAD-dependent epimerase/dehydratase family protein [Litorimonas sp.]|uniref:NAD-dependent epimerase/dehydratase family protein n=1 Tax=Litorimonas sp. TaxID=1892381 RepID=UPI003A8C01F4